MVTEDEAKGTWCPFARVIDRDKEASGNRNVLADIKFMSKHKPTCLASACMAWRWGDNTHANDDPPPYAPKGYCGLAGKPS